MSAEGIFQTTAVTQGSYEVCSPSAIPRSRDLIQPLVSAAVDVFWQCRRYGEAWDDISAPQSYLGVDDDKDSGDGDVCQQSRRIHRRLIFDLVVEILRDIYDDDDAVPSLYDDRWPRRCPPRRRQHRFSVVYPLPRTVDAVKPVVEQHVITCLGLTQSDDLQRAAASTSAARKRGVDRRLRDDAVDRMLVEELCQEEPSWVDYDDDMITRKVQLSDWLCDALVADTVYAVDSASHRRQHAFSLNNSLV